MLQDRRKNRSYNIHKALELQLEATAERACFSSMLLTENQGIPVVGTGDVSELEEIAAFAPQLAPGRRFWQGNVKAEDGTSKRVTVAPIESDVGNLYMCAVGGDSGKIIAELLLSGKGVNRILA